MSCSLVGVGIWARQQSTGQLDLVHGHVLQVSTTASCGQRLLDDIEIARFFQNFDHITNLEADGGNRSLLAVESEVAMTNQLTSGVAIGREAHAVHQIVETEFEVLEEGFTGHARGMSSFTERTTERLLEHSVDTLDLLLLAKLSAIFGGSAATEHSVLARYDVATLDGALFSEATLALEEELLFLPTAESADGSTIDSHGSNPPALGGPASVVRGASHILDRSHFKTCGLQGANGSLTARTRTLDLHVHATHAKIKSDLGGSFRGHLSCERSALARTLETNLSRSAPGKRVAGLVGNGHDGVVEGGKNVSDTADIRTLLAFPALFSRLLRSFGGLHRALDLGILSHVFDFAC